MSRKNRRSKEYQNYVKGQAPKVEKFTIDDPTKIQKLDKSGEDFIKFCEENNVDFTAFFVAFNVWMQVPAAQKRAAIVQLVNDGKIDLGEDVVGKESENAGEGSQSK